MEPWVALERQEGCEAQSGPRKNLRARYHCRVGDSEALPPAKHHSQTSVPTEAWTLPGASGLPRRSRQQRLLSPVPGRGFRATWQRQDCAEGGASEGNSGALV